MGKEIEEKNKILQRALELCFDALKQTCHEKDNMYYKKRNKKILASVQNRNDRK